MENNTGNNKQQQLLETLIAQLGPQDREKVKDLLDNREACQKILNTPEAQELIRKFKGGK